MGQKDIIESIIGVYRRSNGVPSDKELRYINKILQDYFQGDAKSQNEFEALINKQVGSELQKWTEQKKAAVQFVRDGCLKDFFNEPEGVSLEALLSHTKYTTAIETAFISDSELSELVREINSKLLSNKLTGHSQTVSTAQNDSDELEKVAVIPNSVSTLETESAISEPMRKIQRTSTDTSKDNRKAKSRISWKFLVPFILLFILILGYFFRPTFLKDDYVSNGPKEKNETTVADVISSGDPNGIESIGSSDEEVTSITPSQSEGSEAESTHESRDSKGELAVISDSDGFTNLRSGKGTNYPIVKKIYANEKFKVYPTDEKWWFLETEGGYSGYMFHDRVDLLNRTFYIVNVAATSTETGALAEVKKLKDKGYKASHLWIPNYRSLSGASFYSVYVGPFESQRECEYAVDRYRNVDPNAYGLLVSQDNRRVEIRGVDKVNVIDPYH